ncbi:MAG: 16S rRNA (uracil(1498)-N(3))-methyltransferase [Chloroflexi bacterium]|nr:16S rRNA (uracil(1498)-N(3))-methyltransferase [Chloroflexota bacterium]
MNLHRFFVSASIFTPEKTFVLQGEFGHQLSRVLRLAPCATVVLLDGMGREYLAELTHFDRNGTVTGRVIEERLATNEPRTQVTLFQALLKGERFDYVLQKGTEIGVSAFVPVLTERVIGGSSPVKMERWRKIVREAAEQSRRGLLPSVVEPLPFGQALKLMPEESLKLMAWEEEKISSLRKVLRTTPPPTSVSLLVGPEGGFSPAEAAEATLAGIQTISLGSRILRAETAGPTATALILYELGDI